MTNLLRPTLGPVARTVVVASIMNGRAEALDNGATIARRTIQLPDPFENMGGMIVRHLAWRVHETAGDGSTTAAVVATALMAEAVRLIEGDVSPVALRRGIDAGAALAREALRGLTRPIDGADEIARVVRGIVHDERIAEIIGEVVDGVGEDGAILVENAHGIETDYSYLEGIQWDSGWMSPSFLRGPEATARLLDPRILLTDRKIKDPAELVPILDACVTAGERALLVIAPEISDTVLSLLLVNRERGLLETLAVNAPSMGTMMTAILEDIAVSTGGRCVRENVGETLGGVTLDDLGRARQAWARNRSFGILGGQGSREAIRARVAEARGELAQLVDDEWRQKRLRERIGKLNGSAVLIVVGAASESARDELRLRVDGAVTTAQAALRDGVVPGGGAALLACAARLEHEIAGRRDEEALGIGALARALAAPMQAIAANSGLDGRSVVAQARAHVPSEAFDVRTQTWIDPWESGLLDSAAAVSAAIDAGASAAATALMSEVLIHRPDAKIAKAP